MSGSYLSIRQFRKAFGAIVAVDDVSLDVKQGEFLTFLGPSGSGKSTTLYAVAGFDDPTGGDILIQGKSILGTAPHRRNIGMVFQRYTLFPHLTVAENVAFPLRVRRRPAAEIAAKVKDMLALVRLSGFDDRLPAQLSGGQQQRVALARALAYDPPVLLMDEPLSALDKKLREEIQVEIRRIHQETGVTILYVTHDQEEALRLSDRIAVFNHGRIEQVGLGKELYETPATRFVAGFIGDSNFLPVVDVKRSNGSAAVTLPDGTVVDAVPVNGEETAGSKELMVRPQALRFVPDGKNGLPVKVKDVTYLGDSAAVLMETKWGQDVWLRGPAVNSAGITPGAALSVEWQSTDCRLFE
jgi:putative spermidine/putrescine transport system ATP-binding protein